MLFIIFSFICSLIPSAVVAIVLVVQCADESRPRHKQSKKGKKSRSTRSSHKKSSKSKSKSFKRRSHRKSKSGKGSRSGKSGSTSTKKSSSSGRKKISRQLQAQNRSATSSSRSSRQPKGASDRSVSSSQREIPAGKNPTDNSNNNDKNDLRMDPTELRWALKGGLQKVFIKNPTSERRAIKVKCSDNNLYRVNPVYSFVEPRQILSIDVLRHVGEAKVDKMVFLVAQATAEDVQPSEVFQTSESKPMMVLPLIAVNE